ncbi:MAG TPA: c-type cytochrome [Gammaproteobacteria bacterium]|nr:c-type cytochrome [Gammaproteobacteria bacterium]
MRTLIAIFFLILQPIAAQAGPQENQLLQLIDYVGVDYGGAVADGRIVNESEYGEMQDFATAIRETAERLPDSATATQLRNQAKRLQSLVEKRADADTVAALTATMRQQLIDGFRIESAPRQTPDPASGRHLFAENCVSCHGVHGAGDGPLARKLEPAPTNFLDRERYRQRTLFGLYNTITRGVNGTAMPAFTQLSEAQRWNLAFYVGQLAGSEAERNRARELLAAGEAPQALLQPQRLTTLTPAEAEAAWGDRGTALMALLRAEPAIAFERNRLAPLHYAARKLEQSRRAYAAGNGEQAYRLAVDAYLEGFELTENNLDAVDPTLRRDIESAMTGYRNLIRHNESPQRVEQEAARIGQLLQTAQGRLDSTTLSKQAAFAGALIILLREGLEALLVVAALAAFLIKTGRRDGLRYLYGGLFGALVLGGLTWLASNTLFSIGGAQRELTEGIAALVSAAVLFYVGFWLHSKTGASQWKRFIDDNVRKALGQGTLWGLAGLSFIAVYREVFETVLFYQALWMQTDTAGQGMILYGLLAAAILLAMLAWLILRYSTRLPLRQFFTATSAFMFLLAVVFAGKGVAALQEAGKLPLDPVNLPSIQLLGVYPNLQGLLIQAGMVVAAIFMVVYARSRPLTDERRR